MADVILYFDGECNLCNGVVQFIIKRNPKQNIHFASLQGIKGMALLNTLQLDTSQLQTIILEINGQYLFKSNAALRLCTFMGGAWPVLSLFLLVPRFIRDAVYNFIARKRYQWFGKANQCILPKPEWKHRFLD